MKDVRASLLKARKHKITTVTGVYLNYDSEWVSNVKKSYLFTFDTSQGASAATQVSFLSKTKKYKRQNRLSTLVL